MKFAFKDFTKRIYDVGNGGKHPVRRNLKRVCQGITGK